jgi:hypothetical protein
MAHTRDRDRHPLHGALDVRDVYAAVAARRSSFDAMLWQVPVLSFTAQAFLFTLALSSGASQAARLVASGLAVVISLLSLQLMVKQRQAEIADSHWLAAVEEHAVDRAELGGLQWPMHGDSWSRYRAEKPAFVGVLFRPLERTRGFAFWAGGLVLFLIAAVAVLVLTVVDASVLVETG